MAYTNWILLSVIYPILNTVNRYVFQEALCNPICLGISSYMCTLTFCCPLLSEVDLGNLKYSVSIKMLAKSVLTNINMVCFESIQILLSVIYLLCTYIRNIIEKFIQK